MALQPYASPAERIWYYAIRIFCVGVLLGLVLPIFVIIPISFTSDTMLSYPMPGLSFRWFIEFFNSVMWTLSMKNSFIIAFATTFLATALGTLAALGPRRHLAHGSFGRQRVRRDGALRTARRAEGGTKEGAHIR